MKIRAGYKHLDYPYLYDGATQQTARAYGPQATPHVFVFDRQRRLRYEGRVDNSYRTALVKTQDARDAIEALLAGRRCRVPHTGPFSLSTKWKEKEARPPGGSASRSKASREAGAHHSDGLNELRANSGRRLTAGELPGPLRAMLCPAVRRPWNHVPDMYSARFVSSRGGELCARARRGGWRLLNTQARPGATLLSFRRTRPRSSAFDRGVAARRTPRSASDRRQGCSRSPLRRGRYAELRRRILERFCAAEYEGFSRY